MPTMKRINNMNVLFSLLFPLWLLFPCTAAETERAQLAVRSGLEGPESIVWSGTELLVPQPFAASFSFLGADGKPAPAKPAKPVKVEKNGERIVRTYDDVTVTCAYRQSGNRLLLDLEIRNDSPAVLYQARVIPLRLQFPHRPKGGRWRWGYSVTGNGCGEPTVVIADWGAAVLAACNEDPDRPVVFGFEGNYRNGTTNDLLVETLGGQVYDEMPIPPRSGVACHFSLRFAPGGTSLEELAGDIYKAYAAKYPPSLAWNDNRPVGGLFLARDNTKWEKNPRGWFNDDKLDVTTAEGREKFRQRLLAYADASIKVIKDTGGQGMITWDIEGDEMPHAITYLGDPRILPQVAPEMDAIADEYFKRFLDAGLRTGICIRPTTIVFADPVKYPWIKTRYGHCDDAEPVANLCDKIAYAKRRWGCTLFYMDTPGLYRSRNGKTSYYELPAPMLRTIHERHPDVLLMPEFGPTAFYGVGSRYSEYGGNNYRTPDAVRAVYPKAFTLYCIKDDPLYPHWDQVVQGVAAGDILLFRGWFGDHLNQRAKQAWIEASYRAKEPTAAVRAAAGDAGQLVKALSDADPVARYQAALALGQMIRAARVSERSVPALISALKNDSEWIVRRAATQALGRIGGDEALAALGEALADGKSGLQYFAGVALGEAEPRALLILNHALDVAESQRWEAVAAGLARIDDPMAVEALKRILTTKGNHVAAAQALVLAGMCNRPQAAAFEAVVALLSSAPAGLRTEAAKTLSALKDPRAIDPLLALLDSPDKDLYYAKKEAMFALEEITGRDGTVKGQTSGGESAAAWRKLLGKTEK